MCPPDSFFSELCVNVDRTYRAVTGSKVNTCPRAVAAFRFLLWSTIRRHCLPSVEQSMWYR